MKREASELLRKLVFNPDAEEWNEYDLQKLRSWEIEILAKLLGAPKSGAKEKVIERLLCTRAVRKKISHYASDREAAVQMVADFRKEALKWMAKQMCLWRSGSKVQLAIALLQWRDRARVQGAQFLKMITAPDGLPQQLLLPF